MATRWEPYETKYILETELNNRGIIRFRMKDGFKGFIYLATDAYGFQKIVDKRWVLNNAEDILNLEIMCMNLSPKCVDKKKLDEEMRENRFKKNCEIMYCKLMAKMC